jgi:hypothetical protein
MPWFLDVGHRVDREPVDPPRPRHDPVEHREELDLGPVARSERALPGLDPIRGHVLKAQRPERGQQVRANHRPVIAERRRLAVQVVLDVAEVLGAGAREGHTGTNHSGQHAGTRLVEHLAQPRLSAALREVSRARSAPLGPDRSDRLMDLAPIGQPILGSPHRTSRAFVAVDVSGDGLSHVLCRELALKLTPP